MDTLSEVEKEALFQEIKEIIANHRVVLFMKGSQKESLCGFSARVAQILQHLGVPFKDVNVMEKQGLRAALKAFSDWPTFPQLYVEGHLIGGYDITQDMFETGALQELLLKSGTS